MSMKYLILRTDAPVDDPMVLSSPKMWSLSKGGPTDLSLDTLDGHESDRGGLLADPRNVAVLDAGVVLGLIEPRSQASAETASLDQVGALQMPDGLQAVGAHTTPFTGQGVTVAVLDTGIDEGHPAFAGRTIVKKDLTGEGKDDQDVTDHVGHGTHCAATICGAPVDGMRVGVALGVVKLCVGKVLGRKGGSLETLLRGLWWAVVEQRASVVSMSLSYDLPGNTQRMIEKGMEPALAAQAVLRQQSDILKGIHSLRAFLELRSPNVVFVAATGNESDRPSTVLDAGLPAAELFSVGAVGHVGDAWEVAPFSNGRAHVVAPGVDVLSAVPGGDWAVMSGTSMATPHVAGVAALWTEKLRNEGGLLVPDSVRSAIKTSATRRSLRTSDLDAIGVGMVQAPQN